jgi:hypothetical protein
VIGRSELLSIIVPVKKIGWRDGVRALRVLVTERFRH